jgi:hypothetical protein
MKHLFNDISSEEKNRILEMHKRAVDSEMINENPIGKYVGPMVRQGVRAVRNVVNPQKVRIISGGRFSPMGGAKYNQVVGNLLSKGGIVENNPFVQNQLKERFGKELYQVDKLFKEFKSRNNLSTGIDDALRFLNNSLNLKPGEKLDLGFMYQYLLDMQVAIVRHPQLKNLSGPLKKSIQEFETAVTEIMSQVGR